MANASGSQQETLIWVESVWGASPVGVAASVLPVEENNLELTKSELKNGTLNKNRQPRKNKNGLNKVGSDIKFNLAPSDYDNIIASALQGAWTANTCSSAATPLYLGIQKGFTDVSVYNKYVGLAVDELSIEIKPDSLIPCTAKFIGKTMTSNTSSANTTPTASAGYECFDSFTGSILEGNTAIGIVTNLNINVKNGMKASEAVMSNSAIALTSQTLDVSGKLDVYLTSGAMQDKWMNGSNTSIAVTLIESVSGKSMGITIPNIRYTSGDPNAKEGDVIQSLNYSAAYDSSSNTTIKFTRS